MSQEENQLMSQRKQKLKNLLDQNINPYPTKYKKTHSAIEILTENKKLKTGEKTKKNVSVAGRIMSQRVMGKVSFAHIQDSTAQIQVFASQEDLKDYNLFKKLDIGDIIGCSGFIFKTKKGELSIWLKSFELLTKSLRPLPEKWHGLKDTEIRYRKRYLDLIMNPEVKEVFQKRNLIIQSIREFLIKNNFIEVETPILQPLYGGTSARPFDSFLNALKMKVYMRISDELYLKRLITGGYEKIFEFCPDFRNEGVDRTHNPEFLQMETMWAYADYNDNIEFCEKLIEYVVKKVHNSSKIKYQDTTLDFKTPWQRLSMLEAIKKYTNYDLEKTDLEEIRKIANKLNITITNEMKWGEIINLIFEEKVEQHLVQPTIIYDFPSDVSPLAKRKVNDSRFVERFEPYIYAWEIGNSYSELNDPEVLKENFKQQRELAKKGDLEAQPTDNDFIECLEYGMPPTSGLGLGIDRLVMLLTNSVSIRDVIFFPFMRPE